MDTFTHSLHCMVRPIDPLLSKLPCMVKPSLGTRSVNMELQAGQVDRIRVDQSLSDSDDISNQVFQEIGTHALSNHYPQNLNVIGGWGERII